MNRSGSDEFYAALAVGTLAGLAAGLLLRPRRSSARERLLRELGAPAGGLASLLAEEEDEDRALEAAVQHDLALWQAARHETEDEDGFAGEAIQVGRELIAEFREEVRAILDEAREELASLGADVERPEARRRGWEADEEEALLRRSPPSFEDDGEFED